MDPVPVGCDERCECCCPARGSITRDNVLGTDFTVVANGTMYAFGGGEVIDVPRCLLNVENDGRQLDSTVHAGGASRGRWWRGVNKRRLYRPQDQEKQPRSWVDMNVINRGRSGKVDHVRRFDGVAVRLQHRLCRAEHRCCKQVYGVNILEERRSS